MTVQQQSSKADAALEVLLDYLKRTRGFDFTGYKRASLMRRVDQADGRGRQLELRRLPRLPRGAPRRVRPALQHDPDQRHRLLPRPAAWEYLRDEVVPAAARARRRPTSRSASGAPAAPRARRPTPSRWCWPRRWGRAEFRERVKIYATDVDEEALGQARQATYSAKRQVEASRAELLERYFEPVEQRYAVPQGPAPRRHLRPPRPRAGRPDLAHRPARLPQHPDVLQRRDAGADPRPLPLRARTTRLPVPRQGGDAAHPLRPVHARSTSSAASSPRSARRQLRERG